MKLLGFDWEGLQQQRIVAPHIPDIKVRTDFLIVRPYFRGQDDSLLESSNYFKRLICRSAEVTQTVIVKKLSRKVVHSLDFIDSLTRQKMLFWAKIELFLGRFRR